MEFIKFVMQSV